MSLIKVNKIENTATADGGISIDNSGHVTVDGQQMPTAGPLSNRNIIINGAMQVSQRATQVTSSTTNGYKTCDRWRISNANLGTWTINQASDGPAGFANSLKVTCTTADASPGASDNIAIQQKVEAQNLQSLAFGTSSAKTFTLSFYVKSNKTGNASFSILQKDNSNKMVSFQYSISAANTWEYKTITIPGDTAGVINDDNGLGFQMEWWLNTGATYTGGSHQNTWTTLNNYSRNASNLGVGGAVNDYFQITGVQLEVGEKATPFEHRSYGDELQRCLRYYNRIAEGASYSITNMAIYATNNAYGVYNFPVAMRSAPTVDATDSSGHFKLLSDGAGDTFDTIYIENSKTNVVEFRAHSSEGLSGATAGHAAWARVNNSAAYVALSAEL